MAGFVAQLEPVNAMAHGAPGFVWRLPTEDGDATAIRPYDDDRILINVCDGRRGPQRRTSTTIFPKLSFASIRRCASATCSNP